MKLQFKNWLKTYFHWLILAILAICFFIGASSYNYLTQKNDFIKWASPDETANYTFTKLYAQTGELSFFEKYNLYSGEIMHPRSVRSDAGWLKPVSFLGIILIYGKIASVFGYKIIPYLTPLFAAIGIIYFYFLIKKIFGKTNALISACLLASLPPYIYYSARSMFHNVLFVVLFVIGLYYLIGSGKIGKDSRRQRVDNKGDNQESISSGKNLFSVIPCHPQLDWGLTGNPTYIEKTMDSSRILMRDGNDKLSSFILQKDSLFCYLKSLIRPALAGIFIGLAVITRTSELLWLAPALFVLWIFNIKKFGLAKLLVFLSFLGMAILPALYWNNILFGSPLRGGYPEMNQSLSNIAFAGSAIIFPANALAKNEILTKIKDSIFYFGIHPKYSLQMFDYYFVKMFYWIFWPSVAGLALAILPSFSSGLKALAFIFLRRLKPSGPGLKAGRRRLWIYLLCSAIMSIILLFYYGSWEFHDNPDPNQYTIGNSYTRYWLPIYLAAIPFAALAVERLARLFGKLHFERAGLLPPKFFSWEIRQGIIAAGARTLLICLVFFISLQFVLFGSGEGLVYAIEKNRSDRNEYEKVLALTESNSVIITRYHDKLFFPERKVIVGLFDDDNMIKEYANAAKYIPVYYYNFTLPPRDVAYLNSRRLSAFGLKIEEVEQVDGDFSLYRLDNN